MINSGRIVVSYAGVHQAYQLALAAQEIGELRDFYCALYDDPQKWGGRFCGLIGKGLSAGRSIPGLDLDKVTEFPWPLLWKATRDRFYRRGRENWLSVNDAFDRWVARRIEASPSELFVGTASSDLRCLEVAKRRGSTLVHDCPGLHPLFVAEVVREAADRAGMRQKRARTLMRGMGARKLLEYSLADILLVYSDVHRESFEKAGYDRERLFLAPLWADPAAWYRGAPQDRERPGPQPPLKLLFVGSITLQKGVPFLIEAVAKCGKAVELTIVGPRTSQTAAVLGPDRPNVKCLRAQPKSELRRIYESHDVFVLPSVGDSFAFVVLEAMACGLPVIVTENVGAPMPHPGWRVPAMDSERLAARIMQYADDRTLLDEHGREAAMFAAQFTPERYRQNIRGLFKHILDNRN